MNNAAMLGVLTELAAKQAELIFALINFYGLVVLAVVGWLVNTAKDSAGVSWLRILLFNMGFLFFFAATFAGFWYLHAQLQTTITLWGEAAKANGARPEAIAMLTWLPPQRWLWGLWALNVTLLCLSTVVLRRGGGGR